MTKSGTILMIGKKNPTDVTLSLGNLQLSHANGRVCLQEGCQGEGEKWIFEEGVEPQSVKMPFFIKGKGGESNLYLNVEGNILVMSENKTELIGAM